MAKKRERIDLKKGKAEFVLVGEVKLKDFTFKMDQDSKNSDWRYNVLNLAIDTGNGNAVHADMMGGFGKERENFCYVHGKKENDDGKMVDDFKNQFKVAWEDRQDPDVLDTVGDFKFIIMGLERDDKGKVIRKRFLSEYDAIAYAKEKLVDGMVVNVKGNLEYSLYNGDVQAKKKITSIYLSKYDLAREGLDKVNDNINKLNEMLEDASDDKKVAMNKKLQELKTEKGTLTKEYKEGVSKYRGRFTQTVLLDKDSIGKVDKEKSVIPLSVRVVDYAKEYNGKSLKKGDKKGQNIPLDLVMDFEVDLNDLEASKKKLNHLFKVKKGIREITVIGDFEEGSKKITVTDDDIPEDIKVLIDLEYYTKEDALNSIAVGDNHEKRMIIKKPLIKQVTEGETTTPVIQMFDGIYEEEDLFFDFMIPTDDEDEDNIEDVVADSPDEHIEDDEDLMNDDDDNSWLEALKD